jgi:hypothetical protein
MALNLVQHRVGTNVWDRVDQLDWDSERWLAAIAAGALLLAGLRRRSTTGLLLSIGGGALAWWAYKGIDERDRWRRHVRSVMPRSTADPVVEASEESFPASDAPSWTPTTGNTSTCRS